MSQPAKTYTSLDEFKNEFLPLTGSRTSSVNADPAAQGTFLAKQALAELTAATKPKTKA